MSVRRVLIVAHVATLFAYPFVGPSGPVTNEDVYLFWCVALVTSSAIWRIMGAKR